MRRVDVVGIGPGGPDQITLEAVKALQAADWFVTIVKRHETRELEAYREAVLDRHVAGWRSRCLVVEDPERARGATGDDQRAAVAAWRAERAARISGALDGIDGTVAILAWGDPALYDSTLGVLEDVEGVEVRVVPGVSAASALAAAHRTGLNRVGGAVQITTGRRLADGLPADADDVVVMLDPECRFRELDEDGLELLWGAYLGTPDELVVAGPLDEVADEVVRVRSEARERKGWIFDTYLLRRRR